MIHVCAVPSMSPSRLITLALSLSLSLLPKLNLSSVRMAVVFRDPRNLVISEHEVRVNSFEESVEDIGVLEPFILDRFEVSAVNHISHSIAVYRHYNTVVDNWQFGTNCNLHLWAMCVLRMKTVDICQPTQPKQ